MNRERVLRGATSAYVTAGAAVVALVTIGLFFAIGQPFGTLNDTALLVMTLALVPVMVGHYELGGVTPLLPARASLALSALAAVGWSAIQLAMIVGLVSFDYDHAATGAFAAESVLQVVVGAWIAGASLLAGPWLPSLVRWLGIVTGVGTILLAAGLLLGGVNHPLTWVGGIGYQVVLPVWAYLLGRTFVRSADRRTSAAGDRTT